jgi:dethiobiotin synthetase
MSRYFVTGTGTGVGKTFVTTALARLARSRGDRVFAFKPIETGCPDGALGEDQRSLVEAAGGWQEGELAGLYRFERPLAPSVAGVVDMLEVERVLERGSRGCDTVLVEGAGGWRVPITEQHDMRDLARLAGGHVVVVGLATLGTINHSLLTLEAVERDGFEASLVLSTRPGDDRTMVEENVAEIGKRWKGRLLLSSDLGQLLTLHVEHPQPREIQ